MPYAMKITHQDFHVSPALVPAWAQQGRRLLWDHPGPRGLAWEGSVSSDVGGESRAGPAEAWGGLRVLRAAFSQVHRGPSSWQGNILLAAESEFEQTQWLEMLQESGKV